MPKKTRLDAAIHAVYAGQPHSVDAIVCNPPVASQFAAEVREKLGDPEATDEAILWRSMTLRKYGANRGGLPHKPR